MQSGWPIDEIQRETQQAVAVVETGSALTESSTLMVEQAREAFIGLGGSVDEMNTRVEGIAAGIEEVAEFSRRMEADMAEVAVEAEQSSASSQQVATTTEHTSQFTQQIATSAQALADTATELEHFVHRFKLYA